MDNLGLGGSGGPGRFKVVAGVEVILERGWEAGETTGEARGEEGADCGDNFSITSGRSNTLIRSTRLDDSLRHVVSEKGISWLSLLCGPKPRVCASGTDEDVESDASASGGPIAGSVFDPRLSVDVSAGVSPVGEGLEISLEGGKDNDAERARGAWVESDVNVVVVIDCD